MTSDLPDHCITTRCSAVLPLVGPDCINLVLELNLCRQIILTSVMLGLNVHRKLVSGVNPVIIPF